MADKMKHVLYAVCPTGGAQKRVTQRWSYVLRDKTTINVQYIHHIAF